MYISEIFDHISYNKCMLERRLKDKFTSLMGKIKTKTLNPKFVCEDCLVKASCDLSKPCDKLEMDEDKLRDFFTSFRCCPDCGSKKFYEGPSGGMAQNMECTGCGHWFNMGLPLFVQRIHIP